MLPNTVERVPLNTSEEINQRIARETNRRVNFYAANPIGIERRLRELDEEWDIERVLEANAASVAFAGTVLAATVHKRWLMLPVLVTGFLFQHATQGWCPPVPIPASDGLPHRPGDRDRTHCSQGFARRFR